MKGAIVDRRRLGMGKMPRLGMGNKPRQRMGNTPRQRMVNTPRQRMVNKLHQRMDNKPRQRMDNKPRQRMVNTPRQRGVGLVTAIFLLVMLAGLAVALLSIATTNAAASAADVQGARAYQAARAGLEWGLYQNLRTPARRCDPSYTFALPAGSSLAGFSVTVTCARLRTLAPPDPAALDRWVIRATACNAQPAGASCPQPQPGPDYVQRRLEVSL